MNPRYNDYIETMKERKMTVKIKELTPKQGAMIPVIRDEFIAYGLSTEPADWETADAGLSDVYVVAGLDPPKLIFHFASPFEGCVAANVLNDKSFMEEKDNLPADDFVKAVHNRVQSLKTEKVLKNYIYASGYGQHDAGWVSFYNFFDRVFNLECTKKLEPLTRVTKSAGWFWAYKDIAIITDRPELLKRDKENRLHCEDGPAIRYRDGFAVYCWHGTRIPSEWIEDKANLTPTTALTWSNIEQRRCAMEILGWVNVLEQLNAKLIDTDDDPEIGELVEVVIPDIGNAKFLRVKCGTGRTFALPVPPNMKTALEAQSWTWDIDVKNFMKPEIRT